MIDLKIQDSKSAVEKLFDIICNIYISTATITEKKQKGSFVRNKYGVGEVGIFIDYNLNKIPVEYLDEIKEGLLK